MMLSCSEFFCSAVQPAPLLGIDVPPVTKLVEPGQNKSGGSSWSVIAIRPEGLDADGNIEIWWGGGGYYAAWSEKRSTR